MIVLTETVFFKIISAFDNLVYGYISSYISEGTTRFMKSVTFWGSGWTLTAISLIIAFTAIAVKKEKYFLCSLMAAINLAAGSLLNYILKQMFHRVRPDQLKLIEIGGYSFPSGHSMTAMIFYGFIIYLSIRYFRHWFKYCIAGILGVLIVAIGISRIYLGVHYASDVLGGFIIGLGWLVIFTKLSDKIMLQLKKIVGNQG